MAKSHHVASSFLLERFSGRLALISVGLDIRATSMQLSSAGSKVSSSSQGISMSGSRIGSEAGLGRVEIVMGRGSNAAGDSHHGRTFGFLQGICILLSPLSLDGLPVPGQ